MTERVRTSERIDFQRCPTKWYYRWRLGLTPKEVKLGAPDLGTWWHEALPNWYGVGLKRHGKLEDHFADAAGAALAQAEDAHASPEVIETGQELAALGLDMAGAYQRHYGDDPGWSVVGAEIPLWFGFPTRDGGAPAVTHYLKPDALIQSTKTGAYWLVENKTATQIETLHLPLDPQATSYAVMAEVALRKAGHKIELQGVLYNFARKVLTDLREQDSKGRYLNMNGTVSKRQPGKQFVRHPLVLTRRAKALALKRTAEETYAVGFAAQQIRSKRVDLDDIPKNRGKACPRCPFFKLCVLHEQGGDTRELQRAAYRKQDPYTYGGTSDEHTGWEF